MPITVEGPGGVVIDFPDGTPASTIDSVMRQYAVPSGQSKVTLDSVREQAKAAGFTIPSGIETMPPEQIAQAIGLATSSPGEKLSLAGQAVGDLATGANTAVRQMAKGVPFIGQYLDEANAVTKAAFGAGQGDTFSERYGTNVAAEREQDKTFEKAHPYLSTGLQLGGAVAGTVAGMRAAPGPTKAILGDWGRRSLPGKIVAGGVAGAGLGGVAGFGAGEGLEDRASRGLVGTGVGGVVGAAAPAVAAGASGLANTLSRWGVGRDLGVSSGSVRRVASDISADNLTPAEAAKRAAELGDDAMLLDLGRQTRGRAEAIAAQPGKSQNVVLDAVEGRIQRTADRIGGTLDKSLGKSPNIVKLSESIDRLFRSKTKPVYDKVMGDHPQVWDNTLGELSRRPSIQKAIEGAVAIAKESGDDIASPFVKGADGSLTLQPGAAPNLRFWDYVKRSLDGRIKALAQNPDSAGTVDLRALLETKNTLLSHLDNLTSGAYKQARDIAADKFAVKEAVDTGLNLFKNKMLPEEFKAMVDSMGAVERRAVSAGARRALERLKEVAPANMSEGGRQVYRELLQGGPNGDTAQKLKMLMGDEAAEKLINAALRETKFQSAYETIVANSRTELRRRLTQDTADPVNGKFGVMDIANLPVRIAAKPFEAGLQDIARQGTQRTREGIADLLTRQGSDMLRTVESLAGYNSGRSANTPEALSRILMAASQSQTPYAYGPWRDAQGRVTGMLSGR